MSKKRKLSFTMPKGVMDDPQAPKHKHGLRGVGENSLHVNLVTGEFRQTVDPSWVPGDVDWDDDGTPIYRTYKSMGFRPRHKTHYPPVRWWNDPRLNKQIPEGVRGEDRIRYLVAGGEE